MEKDYYINKLLPYGRVRDWKAGELPEYVKICGMCDGKGHCHQRYTVGCGMGIYTTMGECAPCGGIGLRYVGADWGDLLPVSVVAQILTARNACSVHPPSMAGLMQQTDRLQSGMRQSAGRPVGGQPPRP